MGALDDNQAGRVLPAQSQPSRRAFLGAAGALGVAGAAFRVWPASAAQAARSVSATGASDLAKQVPAVAETTPLVPFCGADKSAFGPMLSGSGGSPVISPAPTAIRWYMDTSTYPNTTGGYGGTGLEWPDISDLYGSSAHALVSIRPDIDKLNAGDFDAALSTFMQQAPAGTASLLTIWHEAATFNLSNSNYPQDPVTYVAALTHLQKLAAGEIGSYPSTDVKIGVIDVNPSALPLAKYPDATYPFTPTDAQDVYNVWMAPNLDWYGCDLYDNTSYDLSAYDELNSFRTCINNITGSDAGADWPVNIPELNSPVDTAAGTSTIAVPGSPTGYRRSDFFHYAWTWLQTIGPASHCSGLLGFWNGPGSEGSPWPPANTPSGSQAAMVSLLETINGESYP
jgi:hypothetical protein